MPRGGKRPGAGRPRKPRPDAQAATPERAAAPKRSKPADEAKSLDEAISQAKGLTLRLLDELDSVTTHAGELEAMIFEETAGDRDSRRRNAMLRAIDLPARAATLKVLLGATRAWAELGRPKPPAKAPAGGKKAQAAAAAETAGQGTEWGEDLDSPGASVN